jgi:hypothetical protein
VQESKERPGRRLVTEESGKPVGSAK